MKRLSQWMLISGTVCVSSLFAMIMFEQAATDVAETLMGPWFAICRAITPRSWQTLGNILLGLMWLISGVVVYSMLIGTACVMALTIKDAIKRRHVIWVIVAVWMPAAVAIADPPQRTGSSVKVKDLDDFEAKLKTDPQYLMRLLAEDRDKGEALLRAAQKERPSARLWLVDVQGLFAGDVFKGKSLQGKEKTAHFKHALEYVQESYDIAVQTLNKSHDEELRAALPGLRLDLSLAALEAGELDTANQHAAETLRNNTDRKNWNYGNIIYDANQILGRYALRQGKLADAKAYLLKAGATPGSPQLNSFGPQMQLARELLEQGEKETVLQYLDLVARFWANPNERTEANSKRIAREHLNQLEAWKRQTRAGKIPDHAKWK